MASRTKLPGVRWFLWLRIAWLRTGILTGIYLSVVLLGWLAIANRISSLERFAETRNLIAGGALIAVMAIPVLRFPRKPARLFATGLAAWAVLTVTYLFAETQFTLLESRIGAFNLFMLGAVSYGFVAVLDWVFLMCAGVRHEHIVHSRENMVAASRHRPH